MLLKHIEKCEAVVKVDEYIARSKYTQWSAKDQSDAELKAKSKFDLAFEAQKSAISHVSGNFMSMSTKLNREIKDLHGVVNSLSVNISKSSTPKKSNK